MLVIDYAEASIEEVDKLAPEKVKSINVFKGEAATKKYGDKGKNDVIEITTKK